MATDAGQGAWYHQPVMWLGALILLASLTGCLWLIALSQRHADEPVDTVGPTVFKVPTNAPADPAVPDGPVP